LDIRDHTSLHAKSLNLKNVKTGGLLELSTNLYDVTASDGIVAASLQGDRIVILTEEGQIRIGHVESMGDLISIARATTSLDGIVSVDTAESALSIGLYNGHGEVTSQGLHAAEIISVIVGDMSTTPDSALMKSDMNRTLALQQSTQPSGYMKTDYLTNRDASLVVPGFVPILQISQGVIDELDDLIPDPDDYPQEDQYAAEGVRYDADSMRLIGQSGFVINNYWIAQFDEEDAYKIRFSFDSSILRPESRQMLNALVAQLAGVKLDRIRVIGYTDRFGSVTYNQRLSEKRAQAVKTYLVNKGIPSRLVQTVGHGSAHPLVECADGENVIRCLQPNRRSEISIDQAFMQ
jgi:outer membrane protein OmpA-like peptidoglycan-associated protein